MTDRIDSEQTEVPAAPDPDREQALDQALDEALSDSFPASDPVSIDQRQDAQ
jgi:hypothetical protein